MFISKWQSHRIPIWILLFFSLFRILKTDIISLLWWQNVGQKFLWFIESICYQLLKKTLKNWILQHFFHNEYKRIIKSFTPIECRTDIKKKPFPAYKYIVYNYCWKWCMEEFCTPTQQLESAYLSVCLNFTTIILAPNWWIDFRVCLWLHIDSCMSGVCLPQQHMQFHILIHNFPSTVLCILVSSWFIKWQSSILILYW